MAAVAPSIALGPVPAAPVVVSIAVPAAVAAAARIVSVVPRAAILEAFVLLLDVGDEVFAELFGFGDLGGIGTAILTLGRDLSRKGGTYATWRNMGSSLSWPVSRSV